MSVLCFCFRIFGELPNSRVVVVIRSAMIIITIHSVVAFAVSDDPNFDLLSLTLEY
jgi:hypothetical protein